MNEKSFRVGNWITDLSDKNRIENVQITLDHFAMMGNYERSGNHPLPFKPIPLTEEWLLKMGFYKKNYTEETISDYWYHTKMLPEHIVYYLPYKNLNIYIGSLCIEFVHQMQNFYFTITGEELEVKL